MAIVSWELGNDYLFPWNAMAMAIPWECYGYGHSGALELQSHDRQDTMYCNYEKCPSGHTKTPKKLIGLSHY